MRREAVLLSCIGLLMWGSASLAQNERPYIGVSLDPEPLPELLVKHLRLEAGQGIRINNIVTGSPVDRAGLERDDIIIAFGGQKVTDHERFVDAVRSTGVGTEVSLEVIHLGEHRQVKLKLESARENMEWKYPPELEAVTSWRPGKIFKYGPDGQGWMEMSFDKIPDLNLDVKKFFRESYTYRHAADGEDYTITIEGDPAKEESQVTVQVGEDGPKYSTTVGNLDALPEKYRGPAQEAVENARKNVKKDVRIGGRFRLPEGFEPDIYLKYFNDAVPRPNIERWSEHKDLALEKIQEQMERLQQRMREMEDRLLEKKESKRDRGEEPKGSTPTPSEAQGKQTM